MIENRTTRWTLVDHKAVVKNWRGRAVPVPRATSRDAGPARRKMSDERTMQWLRNEPTAGSEIDQDEGTGVTDVGYAESVVDTDEDAGSLTANDDLASDPLLRTVGQIKHAYRTRARYEEAESERLAIQRQTERPKKLPLFTRAEQPSKRPTEIVSTSPTALPLVANDTAHLSDSNEDNETQEDPCVQLEVNALVSSAAYRADMVRALRCELSHGRDVSVVVRAVGESVLSDAKLRVQELCTESLLFCARDQEVVPTVDTASGDVSLALRARRRVMA